MLSQQHVVVAQEDHMLANFWAANEPNPLAYQILARVVRRMRLARFSGLGWSESALEYLKNSQ